MHLVRKNSEYTDDGDTVSFADEYMHCDVCGESYRTTEQSMARSRAITDALRKYPLKLLHSLAAGYRAEGA